MAKDFEITKVGICQMQVCTCLPVEQAERLANAQHPTGISSRWTLTDDERLAPVACGDSPDTHRHLILEC